MTGHDDCDYWGLTLYQCMRYHGRVARHHAKLATAFADRADRAGRLASRLALVTLGLLALSLLLQVIA